MIKYCKFKVEKSRYTEEHESVGKYSTLDIDFAKSVEEEHIYNGNEVIKIADTIEELIDLGDLVGLMITDDYDEPFEERAITIRKVIGVGVENIDITIDTDDCDYSDCSSNIVEWYIKAPNGDYKLVAKKKSLEGELELL